MTTADAVLAVARSQIGTVEDATGHQLYGAWYGMDRVAWCAIFTQWCFAQVGASSLIPRTAYTPTYYQWFQQRGQASSTPQPGDLVFYDWPDSVRRIQHVGFVEAVEPGAIVTIEGNTTSGTAGDQSNGGGVWRRRRARNASIVGYGRPLYTAAAVTRAPAPHPGDDLVQSFDWPKGTSEHKLVCPVGYASQLVARGWFSLACDGDITSFDVWFQGDAGGLGEAHGKIPKDRRAWWELPSGTTQIVVHVTATGPVGACLETLPR